VQESRKSISGGSARRQRRGLIPGRADSRCRRVRNLERAGVPRSEAMKLTGHKTASVYQRYAIPDSRSLAEGVEKLARLYAEPAAPAQVVPIRAAQS
jgi:hypothetical protein